jgi:hypothetical protein
MDLPGFKKLLKVAVVGAYEALKPHIEQLKRDKPDAPSVAPVLCTCGHLLGEHLIAGGCGGTATLEPGITGECHCERFREADAAPPPVTASTLCCCDHMNADHEFGTGRCSGKRAGGFECACIKFTRPL